MIRLNTTKRERRGEEHESIPFSVSLRLCGEFRNYFWLAVLILALTAASASAMTQSRKKPPRKPQSQLADRLAKSREDLINAAKEYKASLEKLLSLQERDVKDAAELVERRKVLYEQNIISKREMEQSEQALVTARAKAGETRRQMAGADNLIAEVRAAEQLAKLPPARIGAYTATAALIRYNGSAPWALADAGKVETFFATRFGRSLPISAFGQTAAHDHLGFDHRNALDVAVHPDSAEGQAIMGFLRGAGIPFIAFRQAVPGSSTGAHIHIGYPSRRTKR